MNYINHVILVAYADICIDLRVKYVRVDKGSNPALASIFQLSKHGNKKKIKKSKNAKKKLKCDICKKNSSNAKNTKINAKE